METQLKSENVENFQMRTSETSLVKCEEAKIVVQQNQSQKRSM